MASVTTTSSSSRTRRFNSNSVRKHKLTSKASDPTSINNSAPQLIKCVLIGDETSDKNTLLYSYISQHSPTSIDFVPPIVDNSPRSVIISIDHDHRYRLELIDTTGQERFDRLNALSYLNTNVFLVCFSIANRLTFENVQKWVDDINLHCPNTPFILVGTTSTTNRQQVLPNDEQQVNIDDDDVIIANTSSETTINGGRKIDVSTTNAVVSTSEAKELAKLLNAFNYVECSTFNQDELQNLFREVIRASNHKPNSITNRRASLQNCQIM